MADDTWRAGFWLLWAVIILTAVVRGVLAHV